MYLFYKKGAKDDILNWLETKGVSKEELEAVKETVASDYGISADQVYVVNSKVSKGRYKLLDRQTQSMRG